MIRWFKSIIREKPNAIQATSGLAIREMLDDLIIREGGYIDHPNDRGGPTKFGITLKTLMNHRDDPLVDADDVKALTEDEAREIYRERYLKAPKINRLPMELQPCVCDFAVNSGPRRAIRAVQRTANALNRGRPGIPIETDGVIGGMTLAAVETAVQRWGGQRMIDEICRDRLRFLAGIVERDPTQAVFIKGWTRRVQEFMSEDAIEGET